MGRAASLGAPRDKTRTQWRVKLVETANPAGSAAWEAHCHAVARGELVVNGPLRLALWGRLAGRQFVLRHHARASLIAAAKGNNAQKTANRLELY